MSPVKRPNPAEVTGMPRAANASPMQLRLMEVMSQVDAANESVQKAVESGESSTRSRSDGPSGRSRTNSDAKESGNGGSQANTPQRSNLPRRHNPSGAEAREVQRLDAHFPHILEEDEDDLTSTLDNWLIEQKRGVTTRRKHGHAHDDSEVSTPIEDEGMDGYTTQHRAQSQAKGCADEEVRDEKMDFYISGHLDDTMYNNSTTGETASEESTQKIVRGKYMGNDVEVVGLQYMLAQALMGDADEDAQS